MLSEYQLKLVDLYNIWNGNVKKLVSNFFEKENYVLQLYKLATLLGARIKTKKHTLCIRIQSITMVKTIY